MKRQIPIFLLTLAVLAISAPAAHGCTCDALPKASTAFRKARAVFMGQVIGKTQSKLPANWDSDTMPMVSDVVTFRIEKQWKGIRQSEVEAWIDLRFLNCSSMQFRQGERYLIYADSYKGSLVVYWCDRAALTESLSSEWAQKRVRQLNSFWFRMRARLFPL